MTDIIKNAIAKKQTALSEYESKLVIEAAGIPIAKQGLALTRNEVINLAGKIGYPVVMKGCSDKFTHKTEMGLVKMNIKNDSEALIAYDSLTSKGFDMDGVLVVEMITGEREFVVGLSRDPQFGPYVMFGLGGIYTEALKDVSFRVAPLRAFDVQDMISETSAQKLLGDFRGKPGVDREQLTQILIRIGQLGLENEEIAEIDINPIILQGDTLFAADALVVLNNVS
ncbi:MAG: acetate--CoA ligase family protein [Proteobacteria bacterium]|nr:acetate--CoA ligase family protein [Pseudomonadota bacterium]MBU1389647.1 acetate--CoA ligase family protein [Pseudomonadota bacterium]MBU1542585.1 acetate--CoA ligase family protein [Pseudomonadota bacterium]MBU2483044.1 acetate--CoA ligase family protein [Pseudomonadota bacterium]